MAPERPLPFNGNYASPEEYLEKLLDFATTSEMFQILCGAVHVVDFFTSEKSLFQTVLPEEWQPFLSSCEIMRLLDFLLKDDLDDLTFEDGLRPPESFIEYVRTVRDLSLSRTYAPAEPKVPALPRSISIGMSPKKVHEVANFAHYVNKLSDDIAAETGTRISHFVDFGSGQNYLGRALATEPYNRHVVAVEGREINISGAKSLDMNSGLSVKPKLRRNKKLWSKILEACGPERHGDPVAMEKAIREVAGDDAFDFKPTREYNAEYTVEDGKGSVQYVSGRLDSGDLAEVLAKVDRSVIKEEVRDMKLMAVSIHSCGNLSHFGIRSLLLNPDIRAVAIVGCCYNLLTEKLGPPSFEKPFLRPTLQGINGRVFRESHRFDPQGFPMSQKVSTYGGEGVRFNITARMMACQAPLKWSRKESNDFFTRHFYRAVLQKIFLDRGVVGTIVHSAPPASEDTPDGSPFTTSTNPVVIGTLRKACYASFLAYVRGVVEKLSTGSDENKQCAPVMQEKMASITDEEIAAYETTYGPRMHEISVMWTLMAFSAVAVESLIVADRWAFLREHGDVVERAWVETVFDHKESPRNLVVVGVKRASA